MKFADPLARDQRPTLPGTGSPVCNPVQENDDCRPLSPSPSRTGPNHPIRGSKQTEGDTTLNAVRRSPFQYD